MGLSIKEVFASFLTLAFATSESAQAGGPAGGPNGNSGCYIYDDELLGVLEGLQAKSVLAMMSDNTRLPEKVSVYFSEQGNNVALKIDYSQATKDYSSFPGRMVIRIFSDRVQIDNVIDLTNDGVVHRFDSDETQSYSGRYTMACTVPNTEGVGNTAFGKLGIKTMEDMLLSVSRMLNDNRIGIPKSGSPRVEPSHQP